MPWFRSTPKPAAGPPAGEDADPPDDLACASCGTLLGFDDEDDPEGEAGLPLCGECNRARNFDAILEFTDHG